MPHEECRWVLHLPSLGREPVGGKSLKSVMHGQCDARPMVTFPAAGHHHPLNGTKLCCSVTDVESRTHDLRSHKSKFIFLGPKIWNGLEVINKICHLVMHSIFRKL